MFKKYLSKPALLLFFTVLSCIATAQELSQGIWRATLAIQGKELPFQLDIRTEKGKTIAYILNADEKLRLDEITFKGDSVFFNLHIFEAMLIGKLENAQKITGKWIKTDVTTPYEVPFRAEFGQKHRFGEVKGKPKADFSGKWSVTFTTEAGNSRQAIGIFKQKGSHITGTFLTATGDYRYLEGVVKEDVLHLSTFDGSHAYLFEAKLSAENQLKGDYFSGKSRHDTFTAFKNDTAALPDADKLTYLKEGHEQLSFSFPNLDNQAISLQDERFKGKVVLIQIMGSWCPNCMDETAFLAPWYTKNKAKGVEIIGLAYENTEDFATAKPRLEKLKKRYQIGYEILFAGKNDKDAASRTLPALNKIMSFPTTILIDRQGKVRRIHTGFSGPGTGKYYQEFTEDFKDFMDKLLKEKVE
jgi:thiol-disulfide isomerase/thioredoxin